MIKIQIDETSFLDSYDSSKKKNATCKPRSDVMNILRKGGVSSLLFDYEKYADNNIYRRIKNIQYIKEIYRKNTNSLINELRFLDRDDIVFFQLPIIKNQLDFSLIFDCIKQKGIKTVGIVHDADFLRNDKLHNIFYNIKCILKRLVKIPDNNEKFVIRNMDLCIVHNKYMKNEFIKRNLKKEKELVELELFDYLIDSKLIKRSNIKEQIVIAGNLNSKKAKYIRKLPKDVKFGLYGIGINQKELSNNAKYYGSFFPEDLVYEIKGKYGLVWDGNSPTNCVGSRGVYLKYNNPHKASLYLTSGLPIVVWRKAAIADFVIEHNCGIVVDSLNELNDAMKEVPEKEYIEKKNNAIKIGYELQNGKYTEKALNKIFDLLNV